MDPTENDHAAVRLPPPLVYLAVIAAGVLLHAFVMPLPITLSLSIRIILTTLFAVLGLTLAGAAVGLFKKMEQDPKPWTPTPEIVSTGVYRFTRNPMYLGMALLQFGIGVGLANAWVIVLLPLTLAAVHLTAIRHEEAYLERKFGRAYADYKSSVRRWL